MLSSTETMREDRSTPVRMGVNKGIKDNKYWRGLKRVKMAQNVNVELRSDAERPPVGGQPQDTESVLFIAAAAAAK